MFAFSKHYLVLVVSMTCMLKQLNPIQCTVWHATDCICHLDSSRAPRLAAGGGGVLLPKNVMCRPM